MKMFGNLCYALGIVVAIGVGYLGIVPYELPDNHPLSGSGGPGCQYIGYNEYLCSSQTGPGGGSSPCTMGSYKISSQRSGSTTQDFKSEETYSPRGNCAGNPGCTTPATTDLTSSGCGS